MPLILRAVSLNDVPLTQPISTRFDAAGGTIGRVDANTMALPDPERYISRQQARIVAIEGGYEIHNIGAANSILVRNQRLMQGESAALAHRDQVRIGGYLLEVVEESEHDSDVRGPGFTGAASDAWPIASPPPLSAPQRPTRAAATDLSAPLSGNNPFADLLTPPPSLNRAAAPLPGRDAGSSRLPDDFDPFGTSSPPPPPAREASPTRGVFGDLIPDSAPSSLDAMFGLERPGERNPLANFVDEPPVRPAEPGSAGTSRASTDPFAMFDTPAARPPAAPPITQQASDHVPELRASFRPPRPLPVRTEPADDVGATDDRSPASDGRLQGTTSDPSALWAAFCEGAALKPDRARALDEDSMRIIGALLRSSVEGVMQLIAVRSATRHELHAQVTVIRPRDNNPLKFSPDAQSALEQMLDRPLRGFLPGPEAMVDAMNDLVGHAIGSMAGTRAALEGVLGRFAPEALEQKLIDKSMMDSVLPMARRAKLWNLYLQQYEAIREEAQEDFHALFGKAFLAAYEQQLDRLRKENNPSSFE